MAILIDPPQWPAHGTLWSHLVSDSDYAELHAFAARLRVPRRGFDLDHYDVPASLHARAIELGALPVSPKEVVHRLRASGLRVRAVDRAALRPVRRREYLREAWARLGSMLHGAPADGGTAISDGSGSDESAASQRAWLELGESLIVRWNEPHRSYHDERHLEDVLLSLNQLEVRDERIAPATLLAAWFHDAVYAGSASDELDSAALAVESLDGLGLEPALIDLVRRLVLATTPGHTPQARSGARLPGAAHLLDADLAVFAASPQRYDDYARAVRAEYAHVPEPDFRAGRAQILEAYLERSSIYRTAAARQLWEDRARLNLVREISELRGLS